MAVYRRMPPWNATAPVDDMRNLPDRDVAGRAAGWPRVWRVSDVPEPRVPPRTLAGATILQIVPALREEAVARTAVDVAHALLQWGARALIAAEGGPLVNELTAAGAEWIPYTDVALNPFKLRSNARLIEQLIAFERVDIVHAHSPGAAWSARLAAAQIAVWLVTTLPDAPAASRGFESAALGALAQGDRIISPSNYAAAPIMKRYGIPREQVTVIPRGIDTATFNPASVAPERVAALRSFWRIGPGERVVLAPGRVAPWNGQNLLPQIARLLTEGGVRDVVFVIAGEHRSNPQICARGPAARRRRTASNVCSAWSAIAPTCRPPMPPPTSWWCRRIEPPVLGRVVAQAQAMGRPVVTSGVGVLPEHVLVAAAPAGGRAHRLGGGAGQRSRFCARARASAHARCHGL